jgi:AcrR family transcriptional regulator
MPATARVRGTRSDGDRTRRAILAAAVRLATVEGLDGLSIGDLAGATGVSKSGLYAHFGSKQELQLATIDAARELFVDVVVTRALTERGLRRLRALCDAFLTYVEERTLPGGCFFAAAAAELGARPGLVRERVATYQRQWMDVLKAAADEAIARGELAEETDTALLVFELNAIVVAANTAFILHDDPAVIERARAAVAHVVDGASTPPAAGEPRRR